GTAALRLRDPVALKTLLVVDVPPEPDGKPVIYWDGWLALRDATLRTGVELEQVTGQIACRGRYNGQHLDGVVGNLFVSEATLFNQPVRDIRSPFEVSADAPEVLRFPGLHASFFGGEVYGPLRVEFGPTIRYELKLTASQVSLEEFGWHNI